VVECDEGGVVAGHKGHPDEVQKKGGRERRRRRRGERGRATLEKEKPPIFGLLKLGGEEGIRMRAFVKQITIKPLIESTILPGTLVNTDQY
jgi:hypothetical protein